MKLIMVTTIIIIRTTTSSPAACDSHVADEKLDPFTVLHYGKMYSMCCSK